MIYEISVESNTLYNESDISNNFISDMIHKTDNKAVEEISPPKVNDCQENNTHFTLTQQQVANELSGEHVRATNKATCNYKAGTNSHEYALTNRIKITKFIRPLILVTCLMLLLRNCLLNIMRNRMEQAIKHRPKRSRMTSYCKSKLNQFMQALSLLNEPSIKETSIEIKINGYSNSLQLTTRYTSNISKILHTSPVEELHRTYLSSEINVTNPVDFTSVEFLSTRLKLPPDLTSGTWKIRNLKK